MRFDWRLGNGGLLLLSMAGGYAGFSTERLAKSNTNGVACLAILIVFIFLGSLGPFYSLRVHGSEALRRPSWRRSPFGFWRDPLQFLAVGTVLSLAAAIVDFARLPGWAVNWTIGSEMAAFLGLLIGQAIAYLALRRRLVENSIFLLYE
jgi:hypothetical protein